MPRPSTAPSFLVYPPTDVLAKVRSPKRLRALRRTALLDTPAEATFDRLSTVARKLLSAPVALVSLVDEDRQFFKSCLGLPEPWASMRETPLTHSFCQHVAATGEPLVLEDARDHEVLQQNLAIRDLNAIAYAGIPLVTSDGYLLGTFCVIDHRPRSWTKEEIETLKDLTAFVIAEVEQRVTRREAEEARKWYSFLAEATRHLSSTLDYDAGLRQIARLAVPKLADLCVVYVLLPDGRIDRVAAEAARRLDSTLLERLWEFPIDPEADAGVSRAIRTGDGELYREGAVERLAGDVRGAADQAVLLRELGVRSWLYAPLRARGRTLGAIGLVAVEPRAPYEEHDLRLALELSTRAALVVDNARLYQERTEVARVLQRSLLPSQLPAIDGIEIAGVYRAAHEEASVGGDFYDVFSLDGEDLGFTIGDVCGKGVDAAALTGLTRYTVRASAAREPMPSEVLETLNDVILLEETGKFCTIVYGSLRPDVRPVPITLSCGGHPLPLILRADGEVEAAAEPGLLVGVEDRLDVLDSKAELEPGDVLVLYTDGVYVETGEGRFLDEEGFRGVVSSCRGLDAKGIAHRIDRRLRELATGAQRDDLAILVFRVQPESQAADDGEAGGR